MAKVLFDIWTLLVAGLICKSYGQAPMCSTSSWACQSAQAKMQQVSTFKSSDSCFCIAENVNTPNDFVKACLGFKGFPMDIRSSGENGILVEVFGPLGTFYPPPYWIGLMKDANNKDIWIDQCTNSTVSSYSNYIGGSASTTAGTAYGILQDGTWKAYPASSTAGVKYGLCRKDGSPCARGLCKNGATCVPNGNCFTCTCQPGFGGRYCENVVTTTPTIPTTPATLPSCSISGGTYPACIPDEIETGCDDVFTPFPTTTCSPKTSTTTSTTATTPTTTTPKAAPNPAGAPAAIPAPAPALLQNPAPQKDQPIPQTGGQCETWIQCHIYWVILATFAAGTMLIAIIGLMYSYCCKPEPTVRVDPVYPMHAPPPPIAH